MLSLSRKYISKEMFRIRKGYLYNVK